MEEVPNLCVGGYNREDWGFENPCTKEKWVRGADAHIFTWHGLSTHTPLLSPKSERQLKAVFRHQSRRRIERAIPDFTPTSEETY